jgi:hypothetical protein
MQANMAIENTLKWSLMTLGGGYMGQLAGNVELLAVARAANRYSRGTQDFYG